MVRRSPQSKRRWPARDSVVLKIRRAKPEDAQGIGAVFDAAVREGWRSYLDDPKAVNQQMNQLNPAMDLATFAEVADVQKPLIETDAAKRNGLGTMTKERWETLIGQFKELGDISKTIPAEECFRVM